MKEDLEKIINHYGVMPQLKYFQSEVFELNEAIIEHKVIEDSGLFRSSDESEARQHIIEEFADVMVMLEQFKAHYNLDNDNIIKTMKFKIARQLERMNNENK